MHIARAHSHVQAIDDFGREEIEVLLQERDPVEIVFKRGFKLFDVQPAQIRILGAHGAQGPQNGVQACGHVVDKLPRPIDRDRVLRDLGRYPAVFREKDVNGWKDPVDRADVRIGLIRGCVVKGQFGGRLRL